MTNAVKVIDYLITGNGSEPEFGLAAVYTAVVAAIGLVLMWNHRRNNRSVGGASALLRVEANAAKMASLISAGAMTVADQDRIRAHTLEELGARVGPIRLTLVFSAYPIHAVPSL